MAPAAFHDLPTELILLISTYLIYPSHIALRMTCQALRSTIPPLTARPLPSGALYRPPIHKLQPYTKIYDIIDLLYIELWPCYTASSPPEIPGSGDYFACSLCLKILSAARFNGNLMIEWRGKSSNLQRLGRRVERLCIRCESIQRSCEESYQHRHMTCGTGGMPAPGRLERYEDWNW